MMTHYKDLSEFLFNHNTKNTKNTKNATSTHTRIPDPKINIYGGSFFITDEEKEVFYKLYYDYVFVKNNKEYLTERQLENGGAILIDIDLRYEHSVCTRQHTKDHIVDILSLCYLEELKKILVFEPNKTFPIYVFEKPDVNRLEDGSLTKDGIHIIIGIQMEHTLQMFLRDKIVEKIHEFWELPIINTWDSVFDEGISKGVTGWQMFGSRKPGNQAYNLSLYYLVSFDSRDGEFIMDERDPKEFDLSTNYAKICAQYGNHVSFEMNPQIKDEYEKKYKNKKNGGGSGNKKTSNKPQLVFTADDDEEDEEFTGTLNLEDIDTPERLKMVVERIMKNLSFNDYYIKEAHEYVQILPAKYYEPGSHLLNRQVAFALKNTDDRLFLSWIMLRSKADDFDYGTISKLYNDWNRYFKEKPNGITIRSVMYWAKQDAFEEYQQIKKSTLDYYIEETLNSPTEFDFALVLHHMFKDNYVCSNLTNRTWYVFKNHRWEIDKGQSLRMAISVDMYKAYHQKISNWITEYSSMDPSSEEDKYNAMGKRISHATQLAQKLKKTNDKNNIMREALEIFYDREFEKNLDSSKWLLCFKNGVVDLKNKTFRDGYPQDYISKSTNIDYQPFDDEKHGEIAGEITGFMEQIFPDPSLNVYMWDHLASTLIGENINQTFNIYRGNGSNGKSILTDLMSSTLGDYAGIVPITLVTEKRPGIGGTSSEIMQLKGVRYAVMQEPSKDARINEGMLKQLTGDSTLSGRALYCESETFAIQFHLCVCTNTLFEIVSNDEGTWRRIRLCDFISKFVDKDDFIEGQPNQFPKDKNLKDKLPKWALVFASMLVKKAFENQGIVNNCHSVKSSSSKYRQGQDHISTFVSEMIRKVPGGKGIRKTEIMEQFKVWFMEHQGTRKVPKGTELYEYLDNKFGKYQDKVWKNVEIIYPDKEEDDLESMQC